MKHNNVVTVVHVTLSCCRLLTPFFNGVGNVSFLVLFSLCCYLLLEVLLLLDC